MNPESHQWHKDTLHEEERLIWEGKPAFWPYLMIGSWWMVPFSLVWGGFFIFLEIKALRSGSLTGATFVFPFFLFGLYLIVGRFWTGIRHWRNTFYIITDRRIIIRTGTFKPKTLNWVLAKISTVNIEPKKSGLGNINFVKSKVFNVVHPFGSVPSYTISDGIWAIAPSFRYIKDCERVYRIIQSAHEKCMNIHV